MKPDLRKSLSKIVHDLDIKLGQRIQKLSPAESSNWKKWKLKAIKYIVRLKDKPKPLDKSLIHGMEEIKTMQVVVKQADKNLGLVPIRGDIYRAMVLGWVSHPYFQKESVFPQADILRRIDNTIRSTTAIPQNVKQKWLEHARQATEPCPFYAIPKIHKKNPQASRPISAQHSYILAPLSRELAKVLLIVQSKHTGITKDTLSFIQRIENFKILHPFVFLTYDVEALYPSIDINDAITTLHDNIPVMRENNAFWTKVLQLIMYNNYVLANGNLYRQMMGTATGTQVAPPFANLYLYYKFKNILDDPSIILQERYIDDGFILVSNQDSAIRIITALQNCTNLNLTYDIDTQRAIFLDLIIHKGVRFEQERRLDLRTYFKPTNRLLYLPMASNHPAAMKSGIIKGEAIRTLRNSSNKLHWLQDLGFIFKGLMARGYPPSFIQRAWKSVNWEDREFYITCRTSKQSPQGTLLFTKFHPETKFHWRKIITQYPFENIFPKRLFKWNQRQLSILNHWPPNIIWHEFRKIGNHMIASRQCWNYPSIKRKRPDQSGRPRPTKRLREV